jgi:solute carrier family 35 protein F1/2
MWGVIINGIQAASLEHNGIKHAPWDGKTVGFLAAYTAGKQAIFMYFSVAWSKRREGRGV